jgi:hypothetical protein
VVEAAGVEREIGAIVIYFDGARFLERSTCRTSFTARTFPARRR